MTCTFSPTFKAEWSKLTDEQKFTVLGELMDPGVGGIGGFEAQLLCDLGTGGRVSVVIQASLDEGQDLSLAWRQF